MADLLVQSVDKIHATDAVLNLCQPKAGHVIAIFSDPAPMPQTTIDNPAWRTIRCADLDAELALDLLDDARTYYRMPPDDPDFDAVVPRYRARMIDLAAWSAADPAFATFLADATKADLTFPASSAELVGYVVADPFIDDSYVRES